MHVPPHVPHIRSCFTASTGENLALNCVQFVKVACTPCLPEIAKMSQRFPGCSKVTTVRDPMSRLAPIGNCNGIPKYK